MHKQTQTGLMRLESSRWLSARSMLGFCLLKRGVTSALCYLFTLLVASDVFLSHAGEEWHTGTCSGLLRRTCFETFRGFVQEICNQAFLWVVYLVANVCVFWGGPGRGFES